MTEVQGVRVPPKESWLIAPGCCEVDIRPLAQTHPAVEEPPPKREGTKGRRAA